MKRIAIIGSGISGLGAAYALKDTADITVFEASARAGGHSCTLDIDHYGQPLQVDAGFIVCNDRNYPNLLALFDALGVETQPSDMSFSVSEPGGLEWASSARGLFAQKRNLFRPAFHQFWRTILKFNDLARAELHAGRLDDATLGEWLDRHGFEAGFREYYILPMAAAIWSTPERGILDFPARSFFEFFDNHRLMHRHRPTWQTVKGGSRTYVRKIAALLGDRLRLDTPVQQVQPFGDHVRVDTAHGSDVFDDVILACHSDQARALLAPAYEMRRFLLGSVRYRPNVAHVHCDLGLMPRRRAAWASWNVLKQGDGSLCLSYWMNRLQALPRQYPVFVTLNAPTPPPTEKTFAEFTFDHPQFDRAAEAAVRSLKRAQGADRLWLAGAWMGRGFHEDGLRAGLSAGLALGGQVPWQPEALDTYPVPDHVSDTDRLKEAVI